MTTFENFEKSARKSTLWLDELQGMDGILDRQEAYAVLRSVFHTLRDRLTTEENAHLSAQLPMVLRGVYFESWRPAKTPKRYERDEFIQHIEEEFSRLKGKYDAEAMISAVFGLLERHITEGELQDVRSNLPASFEDLWPNRQVA